MCLQLGHKSSPTPVCRQLQEEKDKQDSKIHRRGLPRVCLDMGEITPLSWTGNKQADDGKALLGEGQEEVGFRAVG